MKRVVFKSAEVEQPLKTYGVRTIGKNKLGARALGRCKILERLPTERRAADSEHNDQAAVVGKPRSDGFRLSDVVGSRGDGEELELPLGIEKFLQRAFAFIANAFEIGSA